MDEPDRNRRKQMRASSWDYTRDGGYFVTSVSHKRDQLFGSINDGVVQLNPAGQMLEHYWLELETKFQQIELDQFIIMPNHIHGILQINSWPTANPYPESLGDAMKWFKSMTTNAYIRGVKEHEWPRFDGKLWQPGYWDHIIRNDADLNRIREYVLKNPIQWEQDSDNEASETAWDHSWP